VKANPLAQSKNATVLVVLLYQFHQQKYSQLFQNTQLESLPNFSALRSMPCESKISVQLVA